MIGAGFGATGAAVDCLTPRRRSRRTAARASVAARSSVHGGRESRVGLGTSLGAAGVATAVGAGATARTVDRGAVAVAGGAVTGRGGVPARRPASRGGERSAAADAASALRASRSGASPDHAAASRGVWSAAVVPSPRGLLLREPFRAPPRSKALTRSARARQRRAPPGERTSPASARRQAAGRAGAAGAASTGPRSRADRRHVACRAGHGESLPAHRPLRSSRRSRLPRHRPRPRRSPSRAA